VDAKVRFHLNMCHRRLPSTTDLWLDTSSNSSINLGPDDDPPKGGKISQKGAGAHTLCGRCNNDTGGWYARHFVEWCYQGMEFLTRAGGRPSLIYLHSIRPLPTIKQIFTMFFSLHTEQFREVNQELVSFLLNKDSKYLPPKYRVFVYYTGEGRPRYSATSAQITFGRSVLVMAELAFPPFGYVLTYGDKPPDSRMVEISHFARYDYADSAVLELRPPVLPTHLAFPGDYRTREQISRGMQENTRFEQPAE
jgi:hypothetical protein